MKKKILGTLVFLVAAVGVMYLMGTFDGGEVTADDKAQEDVTKAAVEESITKEKIEETMPDFDDTTELDLDLGDFDPAAEFE